MYFSTLNASSLQGAPTFPLLQVFAGLWWKAQTMEDALIKLQSGFDSPLKETLHFGWTAVRSNLQKLPHPMSLSKRHWHIHEMGFTMTFLGWVSETDEDGDFVPFRAMPSQTTLLVNKILLISSLNIHTSSSKKMSFSLYHSAYLSSGLK